MKCYGYCRVSTGRQAEFGYSLKEQQDAIIRHFESLKYVYEGIELEHIFVDHGESAFKQRLIQRTEGFRLCNALQRGDHVIFPKLDRGFRNLLDYLKQAEVWKMKGVTMHLITPNVDTGTAIGKYFVSIMAATAEWESAMKSERIRESNAHRRKSKKVLGGNPPYGLVKGYAKNTLHYRSHFKQLAILRYLRFLRDGKHNSKGYPGLTFREIPKRLRRRMERECLRRSEFRQSVKWGKEWTESRCALRYAMAVCIWGPGRKDAKPPFPGSYKRAHKLVSDYQHAYRGIARSHGLEELWCLTKPGMDLLEESIRKNKKNAESLFKKKVHEITY